MIGSPAGPGGKGAGVEGRLLAHQANSPNAAVITKICRYMFVTRSTIKTWVSTVKGKL